MANLTSEESKSPTGEIREFEIGGLQFFVGCRAKHINNGMSIRILGNTGNGWVDMVRFDDFAVDPHYHAPPEAEPVYLDLNKTGEPREWFIAQIRDHLEEFVAQAGFADSIVSPDYEAITRGSRELDEAMDSTLPAHFYRVPGKVLQRRTA